MSEATGSLTRREGLLGFLSGEVASSLSDLPQEALLLLGKRPGRLACGKRLLALLGSQTTRRLPQLPQKGLSLPGSLEGLTIPRREHLSNLIIQVLLGLGLNLTQHLGATLRPELS